MKYIIIQYSGATEEITEEQANFITQSMANGAKGIKRENGKGWLSFSSISDILSLDKYYKKYPNERPAEERNAFEDIYGQQGNQQIRKPTKRASELMKQGFIDYKISIGKTKEEAEADFIAFRKSKL